eukprot:c24802_g1_i1 orf=502-1737(+)
MAQIERDRYDYVMGDVYDYDDMDFEELDRFLANGRDDPFGTDSDDEFDEVSALTDTTAAQARQGKDIQGIPWERLQFTREKYRETRIQQYENYGNLNRPHNELFQECLKVKNEGKFYEFRHNTRSVKSTIVHFQLRNLVWATSKHDIYLMFDSSVLHWSPLTRKITELLNVAGPVIPASEENGNLLALEQGLGHIQISTMCVKNNLLAVGGFQGEMVCKLLDCPGVSYCAKITHNENGITNAIEIYENSSGAMQLMCSNNDSVVRVFNTEKFSVVGRFYFPWAINHTSVSPDNKLVVVVGDHVDGFLADSQTGKVLTTLKGHLDYSFASAWHPDGWLFATGNQDTTCRLWDVRKLSSSLAILKGHIGAIRSLRFSSDGRFLAMAEPADFVHVFDVRQDFHQSQEIDLFGEI